MVKKQKLSEIAEGITAHLKRFEKDPKINAMDPKYKTVPYYIAYATSSGPRVFVTYINYQGNTSLTKAQALAYLGWLNAGNVGRHYEALRELGWTGMLSDTPPKEDS